MLPAGRPQEPRVLGLQLGAAAVQVPGQAQLSQAWRGQGLQPALLPEWQPRDLPQQPQALGLEHWAAALRVLEQALHPPQCFQGSRAGGLQPDQLLLSALRRALQQQR